MFRYNMQSGQPRGSYPQSATPSAKAVKALTNVMKPGAIAKITPDGFASKRIGATDVFSCPCGRMFWRPWVGHKALYVFFICRL